MSHIRTERLVPNFLAADYYPADQASRDDNGGISEFTRLGHYLHASGAVVPFTVDTPGVRVHEVLAANYSMLTSVAVKHGRITSRHPPPPRVLWDGTIQD